MRALICALSLAGLLSFAIALPGCTGGSGENEMMEYDAELSKKKGAEYNEQMKKAMQSRPSGRGGPPGGRR